MYASCHVIRSLSRDPLDYVHLTLNITLDYGISARDEIGTLCQDEHNNLISSSDRYKKFEEDV